MGADRMLLGSGGEQEMRKNGGLQRLNGWTLWVGFAPVTWGGASSGETPGYLLSRPLWVLAAMVWRLLGGVEWRCTDSDAEAANS